LLLVVFVVVDGNVLYQKFLIIPTAVNARTEFLGVLKSGCPWTQLKQYRRSIIELCQMKSYSYDYLPALQVTLFKRY
jgi:hypothetical protein